MRIAAAPVRTPPIGQKLGTADVASGRGGQRFRCT